MQCDKGGLLYLGSEIPSCSLQEEVVCESEQEKVSCCMIEIEKSCCPETEDKSCASETKNIHFDFETTVSISDFDFDLQLVSLQLFSIYSVIVTGKSNKYISGIPPPKLLKPFLPQIQSFLL